MKITPIQSPEERSSICNQILRGLPLWFGIESAIIDYVRDVQSMETWAAFLDHQLLGFLSLNSHNEFTDEIHVMGIVEAHHRQGVGQKLLVAAEDSLKRRGKKFLTVKTLSASRPNHEYAQTRSFYLKMGFAPLEEFKTLWGPANPCLFLAKAL